MIFFVTGFTGVGKTTIGRELAQELSLDFIDLDLVIEKESGRSIESIFEQDGEAMFRKLENETLRNLIETVSSGIISLGGGTMCNDKNARLILRSGIAIYLKAELSELEVQLPYLMKNRPLFKGLKETEAKLKLQQLYGKRVPYYCKSQLETRINKGFSAKKLANMMKLLTNRSQSL